MAFEHFTSFFSTVAGLGGLGYLAPRWVRWMRRSVAVVVLWDLSDKWQLVGGPDEVTKKSWWVVHFH